MPTVANLQPFVELPELGNLHVSPKVFLWQVPQVSSWEDEGLPPNLPSLVYNKIDSVAWQRLNDFRQWPAGWNQGSGEAVAWGTLRNLELFLSSARFRTSKPPSLFLTDAGHLELLWEGRNGSAINVALTPAGATYFFEMTGEEGEVPQSEIANLAARATDQTV
jgi:hypothetical protein